MNRALATLILVLASTTALAQEARYGQPLYSPDGTLVYIPVLSTFRVAQGYPTMQWVAVSPDFPGERERISMLVTGCANGRGHIAVLDSDDQSVSGVSGTAWALTSSDLMSVMASRVCLYSASRKSN